MDNVIELEPGAVEAPTEEPTTPTPTEAEPARAAAPEPKPERPKWQRLTFLAIVFVAAALRIFDLGGSPAGLFRDEVEKGYNAIALATSGGVIEFPDTAERIAFRDLPYTIDVGSARTSAIYQYLSAPFSLIFGLNPFSTRFVAALAGVFAVVALGAALLRVWPASTALCAMAWLAVCPWHWLFSRWALQGIIIPLEMIGVLAGLSQIGKRKWAFPLAGASLGLMVYTYSGAQPFALAWGLGLAVLYRRELMARKAEAGLGVLLFALLAAPRLWSVAFGGGGARLDAVAVWNADDATALNTAGRLIGNYLAHFNPKFLFFRGDALERHAIPGWGQMSPADVFFLPLGALILWRGRLPLRGALGLAFLLGPVGAAITHGHIPHALRALPMVLPAAAVAGVGFDAALRWARGRGGMISRGLGVSAFGAAALVAPFICARAIGFYKSDQNARRAFQADVTDAFRTAVTRREPYNYIWVNAFVANGYAPYYALYFAGIPPRDAATHGIERFGFIFYDPRQQSNLETQMSMSEGDFMIYMQGDGAAGVWRKGSKEATERNSRPDPTRRRER